MALCAGIKRDGGRCTATVPPSKEYCYQHDPERQEERKRNAARAGRSRPNRELAGIKTLLEDLTNRVLGGEGVEPILTGRASVANQLLNTRLRAVEVERKLRETEELERRLEELEGLLEARKGERRWGT